MTQIFTEEDFESDIVDIYLAQREDDLTAQANEADEYYSGIFDKMEV